VIPFHRAIVEDPAFTASGKEGFSVHTRWIETEFTADIEPWEGAIEEGFGRGKTFTEPS